MVLYGLCGGVYYSLYMVLYGLCGGVHLPCVFSMSFSAPTLTQHVDCPLVYSCLNLFIIVLVLVLSGTYVLRFTAPVEGSYELRIDYEQVDGILGK